MFPKRYPGVSFAVQFEIKSSDRAPIELQSSSDQVIIHFNLDKQLMNSSFKIFIFMF